LTEVELNQVYGPEGQKLEYRGVLPPPEALARLIASFANSEGGKIVIGVAEDARKRTSIVGLPDVPVDAVVYAALTHLHPRPLINYHFEDIEGNRVLEIDIQKYPVPITTADNLYLVRKDGRIDLVRTPSFPGEEESWSARNGKIDQALKKLKQKKKDATQSNLALIRQYSVLLHLIDRSTDILSATSGNTQTNILEVKALLRLVESSLVDTFEIFLVDRMLEIYLAKPETLKSEKVVSIKDVLNCQSMDEFVRFASNKQINEISRGSLDSFLELFNKSYNLVIFSDRERPHAVELFEVRNLYTHRNGRIDAKFLRKCPKQTLKLGEEHQMSVNELCEAIGFFIDIVTRLDRAAIVKYKLGTFSEEEY
jgi:hypothetical protein